MTGNVQLYLTGWGAAGRILHRMGAHIVSHLSSVKLVDKSTAG